MCSECLADKNVSTTAAAALKLL